MGREIFDEVVNPDILGDRRHRDAYSKIGEVIITGGPLTASRQPYGRRDEGWSAHVNAVKVERRWLERISRSALQTD